MILLGQSCNLVLRLRGCLEIACTRLLCLLRPSRARGDAAPKVIETSPPLQHASNDTTPKARRGTPGPASDADAIRLQFRGALGSRTETVMFLRAHPQHCWNDEMRDRRRRLYAAYSHLQATCACASSLDVACDAGPAATTCSRLPHRLAAVAFSRSGLPDHAFSANLNPRSATSAVLLATAAADRGIFGPTVYPLMQTPTAQLLRSPEVQIWLSLVVLIDSAGTSPYFFAVHRCSTNSLLFPPCTATDPHETTSRRYPAQENADRDRFAFCAHRRHLQSCGRRASLATRPQMQRPLGCGTQDDREP